MRRLSNFVAILNHVETFLFEYSGETREAWTRGKAACRVQRSIVPTNCGWPMPTGLVPYESTSKRPRSRFIRTVENIVPGQVRLALWYGNVSWFIGILSCVKKSLKIVENFFLFGLGVNFKMEIWTLLLFLAWFNNIFSCDFDFRRLEINKRRICNKDYRVRDVDCRSRTWYCKF